MSTIRKRSLPAGWYPANPNQAEEVLKSWSDAYNPICTNALSCVVPHAGWEFSGDLAFRAIATLKKSVETVVVVGGHLPAVPGILVSTADLFETPFGYLELDRKIAEALTRYFDVEDDANADNTVEIQLPIVKYLFPDARVVYMRVPPTEESISAGEHLKTISADLDRSVVVVGSTDLTHYGPAYGFAPAGSGKAAEDWVRDKNDKVFLDLLLQMEMEAALEHARNNRSACSAGAAAMAAAFAKASGVTSGKLIGRRLSSELFGGDSFVGYGAVTYAS